MRNLHVLELANGFLDATLKIRSTGKIRVKLKLIKIKITFMVGKKCMQILFGKNITIQIHKEHIDSNYKQPDLRECTKGLEQTCFQQGQLLD